MPPKTRAKTNTNTSNDEPDTGDKRKADDAGIKNEDDPRTEASKEAEAEPATKQLKKTADPILNWLLSDEAFNLAYPKVETGHGEIDWPSSERRRKTPPPPASSSGDDKGADKTIAKATNKDHNTQANEATTELLTYPSSPLSPFQNLTASLILSKPLSHRLGQRTINTLLNPPFGLRTPADIEAVGLEGVRRVMWEARTQHKEKTAGELEGLVEAVRGIQSEGGDAEEGWEELSGLREQLAGLGTREAQEWVGEVLKGAIKGVGETGVGIFLRRVQGRWEEVFPFADKRAVEGSVALGVVEEGVEEGKAAEELAAKLDGDREKLVRVLDVLVGLQLEKKMDEARERLGVKG